MTASVANEGYRSYGHNSARATTTLVLPQIRDPGVVHHADRRLSEPWRALHDRRARDHGGGGAAVPPAAAEARPAGLASPRR